MKKNYLPIHIIAAFYTGEEWIKPQRMIEILQALLTPIVAVATTLIAYQQYRIRRDERSLALYDRRLAIYKNAIGIVDKIRAGNDVTVL